MTSSTSARSATRFDARDLARIAVFAALIAVLGLPGSIQVAGAVPITLQTLGVMLAGAVLGAWRGAISVMVLLALVAVGLPLLSGGRGGLGVFAGASAGYLIGWIFGAFVIGLIVRLAGARPNWWMTALGCAVGGILVIYLFGIPVQSAVTAMGIGETIIASFAFLPGDLIKVVLATLITMALWRAYPRAFNWPRRTIVAPAVTSESLTETR